MRNVPNISVHVHLVGTPDTEIYRVNRTDQVMELEYQDNDNKADKLTLHVDNQDLSNFDEPVWATGNDLYVRWGYPEVMGIERKVRIMKVIGFEELRIEALGGENLLDTFKQTRIHGPNKTYGEIAEFIAWEWGFRDPEVIHIQPTAQRYATVNQSNLSDAQFMWKLAHKLGFIWSIDHDGFHFHARSYEPGVTKRVMTYYTSSSTTEILSVDVEVDVTRLAGSAKVSTHSPKWNQPMQFNVSEADDKAKQNLASHLETVVKDSKDSSKVWTVPGLGTFAYHDTEHAAADKTPEGVKQVALDMVRKAQQMAVKMKVEIVGDPLITSKMIVEMRGLKKRLSQDYYVKSCTHKIGTGYTTQLDMISDGTAGHSTKSQLIDGSKYIEMKPSTSGVKSPSGRARPMKPGINIPGREQPTAVQSKVPAYGTAEQRSKAIAAQYGKYNPKRPGNLDLSRRAFAHNPDGSDSTVRSMGIGIEEGGVNYEVLIPTVDPYGRVMSDEKARKRFKDTGENLGYYGTVDESNEAGKRIHEDQMNHPPQDTLTSDTGTGLLQAFDGLIGGAAQPDSDGPSEQD